MTVAPPRPIRLRSTSRTRAPARAAASAAFMPAAPAPMIRTSELCVLARQLRCGALEALLLALEARLARPGALELVLHADDQAAEPLDLELDLVAVLEGGKAAMIRTRGQ